MRVVDLAIYRTVHEHGGADRLSQFLACRPGTLNNKADPGCDTHHLTVVEAIALQLSTNTRMIIAAEAQALNGVFVQGADWSSVSDMELLDAWARLQADLGETASVLREGLHNHRITRNFLRDVKREMFEDFQAAMELYNRLEALCDEPADEH